MGNMEIEKRKSINDQVVAANEAKEVLKGLIKDLARKSWNATRFMEVGRRMERQTTLRASGRISGLLISIL